MAAPGALKAAAAACALAAVAGRAAADMRPVEELNSQCLLFIGNGCNTIQDRTKCLNSRDGRFIDFVAGRDIRGQACIWCPGGGCHGDGTPQCEPFQFMLGPPGVWIAANCLDGRDIQESVARVEGFRYQMGDGREPAPGDWAPVNGGYGQACRGSSTLDRGYAIWTAVSLEQCKSFCVENCQGVEYMADHQYCEVWYDHIDNSVPMEGYSCHKKVNPLPPNQRSSSSTPAPIVVPSMQQDPTAEDAGEPADPNAEEAAAATEEAKAAAAQEAAEESDGPEVVSDKSVEAGEWPAPVQQVAGSIGGRFVQTVDADGNRGEVFWQDAYGKHDLPSGVSCAECGCDGENVAVISEAELGTLFRGDYFHCMAMAPAAPTEIPTGGRFVVVEEEAQPLSVSDKASASAEGGDDTSAASSERKVYWQSPKGEMHFVPSDYDCKSCSNCAYAFRVAASEVKAATSGADFTCDMVPIVTPDVQKQAIEAMSVQDDTQKTTAADKVDPINSQWALIAIAALLVAGVGFGAYTYSNRKGAGKTSHGRVRMNDDDSEERDSVMEAASPPSGRGSNDGNNMMQEMIAARTPER